MHDFGTLARSLFRNGGYSCVISCSVESLLENVAYGRYIITNSNLGRVTITGVSTSKAPGAKK